ncbi:HAD hydrolase-like protein [Microbacteriaceae bacterium 4G12]
MPFAVIFDMDGTLFQTNTILELALEDTFHDLRQKGLWFENTPIDTYRDIMGVPLPVVWETLLPKHPDYIREEVDAYFLLQLIANIQKGNGALYPNVKEIFHYLKSKHIPIYIASNGLEAYLEAIVEYYRLQEWIDGVFSIEQILSQHKSDLVKMIIDTHKINSGIVVGDRLSDIKAAKENNLLSVGCNFDFAQDEELKQADYIIDDLLLLQSIIETEKRYGIENK